MHFYCIIPLKKETIQFISFTIWFIFLKRCLFFSKDLQVLREILALFASYSVIIFNGLAVLTIIEPHRIHTLN